MSNHQIVNSLTTYLANLTTKLSNLIKSQNIKQIYKITQNSESQIQQSIKHEYRKPQNWNYLKYLNYVLSLQSSGIIKLLKTSEHFSLVQDLHILACVSNSPQKVNVKALQELSKNAKVYKSNYKNFTIKRPLKKIIERYKFLQGMIKDKQIKYIIQWIQMNGLDTEAYIQVNSRQQNGENKLNVKIRGFQVPNQIISLQKAQDFTNLRPCKRKQPIYFESQGEVSIQDQKRKSNITRIQDDQRPDFDKIFSTPQKKIQVKVPNAPYKIKVQDSDSNQQVQDQEQHLKRDNFLRIIDVKKDTITKEQLNSECKFDQPVETTKIQRKISQFIFADLKEEQEEESKVECFQLVNILDQFKSKFNFSQVRILKFLDEVSGDLTDLETFLKTKDDSIRWKRIDDAILRKYYKKKPNPDSVKNSKQERIQSIFNQILKIKGQQKVNKRITYLGLTIE